MLDIILRNEMSKRGLSSHTAAVEIGVSHTTILRALRGDSVDVDTIVKIANFLGVRPSEILNSTQDTALADQIAVLLSHSPQLETQLREAVQKVRDGKMDAATLADVVAYAAFKFHTTGETSNATVRVRSPARSGRRSSS